MYPPETQQFIFSNCSAHVFASISHTMCTGATRLSPGLLREDSSFKIMSRVWRCGLFLSFQNGWHPHKLIFIKAAQVIVIFKMFSKLYFGQIPKMNILVSNEFIELSLFSFTGQNTNVSMFTVVHMRTLNKTDVVVYYTSGLRTCIFNFYLVGSSLTGTVSWTVLSESLREMRSPVQGQM